MQPLVSVAARGQAEGVEGMQELTDYAWVGHSSVRVRASLKSGPLAALVTAEFSWLFLRLAFQADNQRVLKYGGASLFIAGGLAWAN